MNPCPHCDRGLHQTTKAFCLSCKGTGYEQSPSVESNTGDGAKVATVKGKVAKVVAQIKSIKKVVKRK